ncbi:hypothetical protein DPMN_039555 [Dreissena polymorpha]|uniref:Uncharacterized protein n=1 Tax=Dreissena polymorpha TaxID=45954 RepID=A0A9D4CVG7_DREPO|nr:hypothetical protein DPMN_039555 [Dreissena polymorpha]
MFSVHKDTVRAPSRIASLLSKKHNAAWNNVTDLSGDNVIDLSCENVTDLSSENVTDLSGDNVIDLSSENVTDLSLENNVTILFGENVNDLSGNNVAYEKDRNVISSGATATNVSRMLFMTKTKPRCSGASYDTSAAERYWLRDHVTYL